MTRQKNKRDIEKWDQTDCPEIPSRQGRHQKSPPTSLRGKFISSLHTSYTPKNNCNRLNSIAPKVDSMLGIDDILFPSFSPTFCWVLIFIAKRHASFVQVNEWFYVCICGLRNSVWQRYPMCMPISEGKILMMISSFNQTICKNYLILVSHSMSTISPII